MTLIEAIVRKKYSKVKKLLEQGVNPNETLDEARLTPLHFAAQLGLLDICYLLIMWGANLNWTTDDGLTPLDIALLHKHHEIVMLLSTIKVTNQIQNVVSNGND